MVVRQARIGKTGADAAAGSRAWAHPEGAGRRFDVRWGNSTVRWVAICDVVTGVETRGRDYASWEAAYAKAAAQMQSQLRRRG